MIVTRPPSIYEYFHYRKYLGAYYLFGKEKNKLTYAKFSEACGIKSPNYLKLVIDGKKNLTQENIFKFSKAMNHKHAETEYFSTLVRFNQSKSFDERKYLEEKIQELKSKQNSLSSQIHTYEEKDLDLMSRWSSHAILVLLYHPDFFENLTWIKSALMNQVSEEEIKETLDSLQKLGVVERNEFGRLMPTKKQFHTPEELKASFTKKYYAGMLDRAHLALSVTHPDDREFGSITVGVQRDKIPELKKKVRTFLKSLNDWALEDAKAEEIYNFTFTGFPLTEIQSKKRKKHS